MPDNPQQPPPRRWFQFRLRTLLIGVTVLCGVFAWWSRSQKWLEERHAATWNHPHVYVTPETKRITAPRLLWVFGEPGISELAVDERYPETRRQIEHLFPETTIKDGPRRGPYLPQRGDNGTGGMNE